MKKADWEKLTEQDKQILSKGGINSIEDLKKPVWKCFEEADIFKRATFVNLKNQNLIEKFCQIKELLKSEQNKKLLGNKSKNLIKNYDKGDFFEIVPDEEWKKLYSSFRASNEWQNFRMKFLTKNIKCTKCKNIADTPHHNIALNKTALREGFLKALENEDNFESYCQKCHCKEEGIMF